MSAGPSLRIGLALSGGGSRAIAFHLGCLRALHDRGILGRVSVLSSVSGGSVIAALWAFSDHSFSEFEGRVLQVLRGGLVWGIARQTFFSVEAPKILGTLLTASVLAHVGIALSWIAKTTHLFGVDPRAVQEFSNAVQAPLRRYASRSTAFERHLRSLYGKARVNEVKRPRLDVVINAAELRTSTAFRFGSKASGSWRFGRVQGDSPTVSKAVAASAAFPLLLPAFDEVYDFHRGETLVRERVILTDGGVYDNLGITCLLPGRSPEHNIGAFDIDFIICCDAGQGQPTGAAIPYTFGSRLMASFASTHRRTHSMSYDLLHRLAASGELKGFLLPYLGQIDAKVPNAPADLIRRESVFDYPTDFSPMATEDIDRLAMRGEQLTNALISAYHPSL